MSSVCGGEARTQMRKATVVLLLALVTLLTMRVPFLMGVVTMTVTCPLTAGLSRLLHLSVLLHELGLRLGAP